MSTPQSIQEQLQSLEPSAIIELFQLELTQAVNGVDQTYYYHAGTNELTANVDVQRPRIHSHGNTRSMASKLSTKGVYCLGRRCGLPTPATRSRLPAAALQPAAGKGHADPDLQKVFGRCELHGRH